MTCQRLLFTRTHLLFCLVLGMLAGLPACSVNVKKDEASGSKKVDIETPVGGIHVSKNADPRDIGLPVYPGARIVDKEENGEEKSANVNISTPGFGLKVIAIEYRSDSSPETVIQYYKDKLKKYGNVLECHTSKHGGDVSVNSDKHHSEHDKELKCDGDNKGNVIELKVGTEQNQHIVSVEPEGKGSKFALVLVQTRGDETI